MARLVGTPSPSGEEAEAAEALASMLPGFGWEFADMDEVGNVIARRGTGAKELVLLGHIDTVEGGPAFSLEGPVLRGRGSVDAKGPLCALAVAGAGVPLHPEWTITFVAAVGEETDSRGARHRIGKHKPAACIIGEPTGGDGIALAYRGRILARLYAKDGGAHRSWSSGPLTAVVLAASDILEVFGTAEHSRGLSSRTSGTVISMDGSERSGRSARLDLDIRIPLGESYESVSNTLTERCALRGVDLEILDSVQAHCVKPTDPVAGSLRKALRRSGIRPRLLSKSGTSDFNTLSPWGCPMAVYGPGNPELEHTEEEQIEVDGYLRSIEIIRKALENIFTPGSSGSGR